MSVISTISTSTTAWQPKRPDVAKMSEDLFAKLDTDGKGAIDEAEMASALGQQGASASSAASLMKALDGNSDGSVSKDELSQGMQKLSDQFEAQFNAARTTHAHGGPAPASPEDAFASLDSDGGGGIDKSELKAAFGQGQDSGVTDKVFAALDANGDDTISKDELTKGIDAAAGSSGPARAGTAERGGPPERGGAMPAAKGADAAQSSAKQYDAADSNEDGTVSSEERLAYQAKQASKRAEAMGGDRDAALGKLLDQLVKAYGDEPSQAVDNKVSVTA